MPDPKQPPSLFLQAPLVLCIYPLLIPKLFGFSFGYASARMVGLLLVLGAISCLYFTARKFMCLMLARMTVLPVLTFFAFTVHPELRSL